jgi:hypothetical protein
MWNMNVVRYSGPTHRNIPIYQTLNVRRDLLAQYHTLLVQRRMLCQAVSELIAFTFSVHKLALRQ